MRHFAKTFDVLGEQLLVRLVSHCHAPDCRCGHEVTYGLTVCIYAELRGTLHDIGFVIQFEQLHQAQRALERFSHRNAGASLTILQTMQHGLMDPEKLTEYAAFLRDTLTGQ